MTYVLAIVKTNKVKMQQPTLCFVAPWATASGSAIHSGKVVEAEITAITNQFAGRAGRKLQIGYDSVTASINTTQIIEVLP